MVSFKQLLNKYDDMNTTITEDFFDNVFDQIIV